MTDRALDPFAPGPLHRSTAIELLERAGELLEAGEYRSAAVRYQRVIGHADADLTAAAWYGLAEARFRVDDEAGAIAAWGAAAKVGETPVAWRAWKQIAAARVRQARASGGSLDDAMGAYREAERRAPPEERAEIASRLGWLSKESGNSGAARRYFARARGGVTGPLVTYAVLAVTIGVFIGTLGPGGTKLFQLLELDKARLAAGEYWRLFSPVLVHDPTFILHIVFNMYALYIVGPLVEAIYGRATFLGMYLLCAAAGSVGSLLWTDAPSVGASGAIFGLFGVIFAAMRTHQPVLDRRARALTAQIGGLIVINLLLGFGLMGAGAPIDNGAHLGGLATGLWLGFLLVPGNVPTLASLWQRPGGAPAPRQGGSGFLLRAAGIALLVAAIAAGLALGISLRG